MKSLKIGFKIEELILLYVKSGNRDGRKSIARLSDWSPPIGLGVILSFCN